MNNKHRIFIYTLTFSVLINLIFFCSLVKGQNLWAPIPPYNVLWPLWSPALSPPDALGVPTPLVTSLTSATILPIEPAIVWDPTLPDFYVLYNSAAGLQYYDFVFPDFYDWPPRYLLSVYPSYTTYPNPIPLPLNYATLILFDPIQWINSWIPFLNTEIQNLNPTAVLSLLTPADLLPTTYVFNAAYTPVPVP